MSSNQNEVVSGVPTIEQYATVVNSELFKELEKFSDNFLAEHPDIQERYGWVRDPLHQWSRQWEYPFVFQTIMNGLQDHGSSEARILDAGSGATFFPYFLKNKMPGTSITCCDYDASLESIFKMLNDARGTHSHIDFRQADLRRLPFDDASFDVVYCISVLEHTDSYAEIVSEFRRILRPGGLFVTTFDIGLDGVSDIPPTEAFRLAECIGSNFISIDLRPDAGMVGPESISSKEIGAQNPNLMPWRYPLLSWLKTVAKRRRLPRELGKNLSVFCAGYRKAEQQDGERAKS